MNIELSEDVLDFRAVLAPELQRIFDHLAPFITDLWAAVLYAANDYYPAKALCSLIDTAGLAGVVIPEPLYVDAERVVAQAGPAEDYLLNAIRTYRVKHYPVAT